MHMSDGILRPEILLPISLAGGAAIALSLKSLKESDLPRVALFTALFFVASFIHIPVGVSSAHLVLGGMVGLALGQGAFVAMAIALALQALLFGFGGLGTLLVNTLVMALPPVVLSWALKRFLPNFWLFFVIGFASVLLSALFLALLLWLNAPALAPAALAVLIAHIPLALAEGLITALAMNFYAKSYGRACFA